MPAGVAPLAWPGSNTAKPEPLEPGSLNGICATPVYLPNTERERLGLFGYGCDVPNEVIAAAEARLAAATQPEKPATRRKATKADAE